MHFICAYIASIVILASWCKYCIMVIALCHMHHLDRAWDPSSSCCTIIAIIHYNGASCSWLYIEHCTLNWSILSLSLDCIGLNRHVLQSTTSKIIQVINSEQEYVKHHFVNPLYYPYLLTISFVINVIDIYRFHDVILALWEFDHLFLSYLVKLICVQSLHDLVILISSCSHHQPQSSQVRLLLAIFNVCFASLPFRAFRPNLGTRFFLGGEAVTVHILEMLDIYLLVWNMCLFV
jgi:hypothetical protein